MTIEEKLERSKSREKIDFTAISCLEIQEPLVPVIPTDRIMVEPIWTVPGDFEGGMYADYIAEHPEYDTVLVRKALYERLQKAVAFLPPEWKLVVRAGHRPPAVQRRLLKECAEDYKAEHPEVTDEAALAYARQFVSDPATKLPPHCCGAAVDVDVLDTAAQTYVDFGSPVNLDEEISFLHSGLVAPAQKANRMQLLAAMLQAGFASYYAEWWHYSYGDQIWAWFYGENACLYDVIDA